MKNKIRTGRKDDPETSGGVLFQPDQTQFLLPEHEAVPAYEKGECYIPAFRQAGKTAEEIYLWTVTILDDPNFKNLKFTKPESVNHVCKFDVYTAILYFRFLIR